MIDVCLVPVGKVAANIIQEIYSHKSSIILVSHGQNTKKRCMEVLHENCSSSVIYALYIGLPKSLVGHPASETFLSYQNVVTKHICTGWMNAWMGRCVDAL